MQEQETITVTTESATPQGHITSVEAANASLRAAVQARLAGCQPAAEAASLLLESTPYDRRQRAGILDEGEAWPLPHETAESAPQQQGMRPGSAQFVAILEEMKTLHLRKTLDYGDDEDALANVRQGAEFVDIEPWRGCLVRMADKMQRLRTFCRTGRLVHEGVEDTLLDLAAYAAIALVLYREAKH